MKKLGLIGGLSWRSTARYYQIINERVGKERGGLHSAPLILESLDFADMGRCITEEEWDEVKEPILSSAQRLETAGVDGLIMCANSIHALYDDVTEAVSIPVLHIADAVGEKMKKDRVTSAALVGTRNVMAEKFYRQRLVAAGISLLPADMELADQIDRIVYEELAFGKAMRVSERFMKSEITDIAKQNVQALVLACTELEMIVDTRANVLPIYDSMSIHANAAADFILS
ncbi:MAG: amino acid racemase [Sphingobium sp.]